MEFENEKEETATSQTAKKMRSKNDKQATVLKQLSNQSLYPIQERIGIYVIAILSTIGLVLITYTGVMAVVSNITPEAPPSEGLLIDMDLSSPTADESDDAYPDEIDDSEEYDGDSHNENSEPVVGQGVINDGMVNFVANPDSNATLAWLEFGQTIDVLDLYYNDYWSHIVAEVDFGAGPEPTFGFVFRQFVDMDENE